MSADHKHCWHAVKIEHHDDAPGQHGTHVTPQDPPLQPRITVTYRCCWCGSEQFT